jgi:hypothetical protein
VPVISSSYLESDWCDKELSQAATLEANGRVRAILSVRLGNVPVPAEIRISHIMTLTSQTWGKLLNCWSEVLNFALPESSSEPWSGIGYMGACVAPESRGQ